MPKAQPGGYGRALARFRDACWVDSTSEDVIKIIRGYLEHTSWEKKGFSELKNLQRVVMVVLWQEVELIVVGEQSTFGVKRERGGG